MSGQWTTKAFSKNSTPVELDDSILEEKVVILLQGDNNFGDEIYSYVQLTIRALQKMREFLISGEKFMPAEFGTVLAAGKGQPSQELRSEMAVTYGMIDKPGAAVRTTPQKPEIKMPSFAVKDVGNFWDE